MMTITSKHPSATRNISLIAIAGATTLLLFLGNIAFHLIDEPALALAHAAITCASSHGTQQNVCEQQNPIAQGCTYDEQVIELESAYTAQNGLIGNVRLLYSPQCKTHWVATTAYANTPQIKEIDAIISFHTGHVEEVQKTVFAHNKTVTTHTNMLFIQPQRIPTNWEGKFFLTGQTQPIIIPL